MDDDVEHWREELLGTLERLGVLSAREEYRPRPRALLAGEESYGPCPECGVAECASVAAEAVWGTERPLRDGGLQGVCGTCGLCLTWAEYMGLIRPYVE